MGESKVYFTSFKTTEHENLIQKLHRLMKQAGFENIDFNEKLLPSRSILENMEILHFFVQIMPRWLQIMSRNSAERHFLRIAIPFMSAAERMRWIIWIQPMSTDFRPYRQAAM